MKPYDLLEAIGEADEKDIASARKAPKRIAPRTRWIAALAACLVIALCIGILPSALRETPSTELSSGPATAPLIASVPIWFVKDGALQSEEYELEVNPQVIFPVWREKNGIGEEVELRSVFIDTHGTESRYTVEGNEVVTYRPGDTVPFRICVSAALRDYFPSVGEELLLESLKKTLTTPYLGLTVDEYELTFE